MSAVEGKHESFSLASSSSDFGGEVDVSYSSSSHSPQLPAPTRRRQRTREISNRSGSPTKSNREIGQSNGTDTSALPTTQSQNCEQRLHSPGKRQSHRRSPSATLLSEDANYRASLIYAPDTSSGSASTTQTLGRRQNVATNPPNAWLQRGSNNKVESQNPSSPLSPSHRYRDRSGSVGSYTGSEKASPWQEAVTLVPESPSGLSGFRRSLSRRSVASVQPEGSGSAGSVEYAGSVDSQQTMLSEDANPKEKRKLFGRGSERPASASGGNKGGILRRVGSRGFFGGNNKDKDLDANASTDTLASTSSSSTARKQSSLPQWTRRSKNKAASKRDGGTPIGREQEGGINQNVKGVGKSPDGLFGAVEEQGDSMSHAERNIDGDLSFVSTTSENRGSAINGSDLQDRGDGLPKRLSGWLSNMLINSASTTTLNERDTRLAPSESNSTVRRKSSTASLSRATGSEQSPSNVNQTPAPRARNIGLLSTLSASGRARADPNTSLTSGGGARGGLDRALRYFLASEDQNQNQDEGIWLLGVWHGPKESSQVESNANLGPTIEVINPSPNIRASKASTLEGDASSQSRRGSDLDPDDASTEDSSRRTRETSPSIASASTDGSRNRSEKDPAGNSERSATPEEQNVLARNPPTPHTSPLPVRASAASMVPTTLSSKLDQSLEQNSSTTVSHITSFQSDFSSRIWCTYRSHFVPITRDGTISSQAEMAAAEIAATQASLVSSVKTDESIDAPIPSANSSKGWVKKSGDDVSSSNTDVLGPSSAPTSITSTSPPSQGGLGAALGLQASQSSSLGSGLGDKMGIPNLWSRATAAAQSYGLSGRAGLTTDAGWGCMLRTGQSVLANALLNVHLGRDWRRGPRPPISLMYGSGVEYSKDELKAKQEDYIKYVQLLSWFMDEPSLACPFGVHRMAREGKRLGKEVGEWFGPSTAAGAIKKLVDDFPEAGLGVSMASDGVVYLNQVKSQAQVASKGENGKHRSVLQWDRPVLVLIGIRLGLEGVHPMYHDSIKATFSFPQSVGIAGGRPSSSYYFVGYQANSLFYLDPHHVRSSVPFRHPPPNVDDQEDWWMHAYSEAELSTYHNDRPRRMPMKSLDPSMLLGFLIKNEDSLHDFVSRVKALPRPIFSVLESMPKWMMEDEEGLLHEDEKALESFSESSVEEGLNGDNHEVSAEEMSQREEHRHAEEQPRHHDADDDDSGLREEQGEILDQSMMSNMTTTPRSESTFEFIDRQAAAAPMSIRRPSNSSPIASNKMRNQNHPFPNIDGSRPVEESRDEREKAMATASEEPIGGHSFTDSDGGSAWEEVTGSENDPRRETSLLVDTPLLSPHPFPMKTQE